LHQLIAILAIANIHSFYGVICLFISYALGRPRCLDETR